MRDRHVSLVQGQGQAGCGACAAALEAWALGDAPRPANQTTKKAGVLTAHRTKRLAQETWRETWIAPAGCCVH